MFDGQEFALGSLLMSGVTYTGMQYLIDVWEETESLEMGVIGLKRAQGRIHVKGGYPVVIEREILLAAGLPYLYIKMWVSYPLTPFRGFNKGRSQRLEQAWDNRWQEVLPCEIRPALTGTSENPLRVWKHNYCDHVTSFSLDYGKFSSNQELDSVNNQITSAWVGVTDGKLGMLVAQTAEALSNFAFCPMRTRQQGKISRVRLNPFGSYWGRQYRYDTADTGLGNFVATNFSASDHISPYAPSFNGRRQEFSLLIAPYVGNRPPDDIQYDAEAFAYPYLLLEDTNFLAPSAHRGWDGSGLGSLPA
jgi:hypothetical protein